MIESKKIFCWIPATVFHGIIVASQSFHRHTIGQHIRTFFLITFLFLSSFTTIHAQQVVIKFHHIANGKPLVLSDSSYTNAFNESYQVTRLKYYVSNIGFDKSTQSNVELIDASAQDSIILNLKPGNYSTVHFTLGVDSALNCSGAQAGALDPLNGMFWTWNTGYIFFKMEGYSTASTADLQRIEQHIGGYRYPYNAIKNIELRLKQPLHIKLHEKKLINIAVNLDGYWNGWNAIKIAQSPLIMKPGVPALAAALNISDMFYVRSIE